jgi:hypothetical protein
MYTLFVTVTQQMRDQKRSSSSSSLNRRQPQRHRSNNTSSAAAAAMTASNASTTLLLRTLGSSIGVVYVYYIIQCPMEGIQNKESYIHNGIAAFTLSYIGLAQQRIGIPIISPYIIYELPLLARNIMGASIYSCLAMTLAAFYGQKPF